MDPSKLHPAGETGRILGLTHAVRFPALRGEWGWIPDLGRINPPSDRPAFLPEPEAIEASLASLPLGAALVGPVPADETERGEAIVRLLRRFGWAVLLVRNAGGSSTPSVDPLRIEMQDGLFAAPRSPGVPALVPALFPAGWTPGELGARDLLAPLEAGPENHRLLVRWAEATGRSDAEALFGRLFAGASGDGASESPTLRLRPAPWPRGFPSLGAWLGARLRVDGALRGFSGAEGEEAELLAAARRIEEMVPAFEKIVEAGLAGQVPGIGEMARLVIGRLIGEAGDEPAR